MDAKYYNYVCFRPWNGVPCYVGKGQGTRAFEHVKSGSNHYNKHFGHILTCLSG